MSKLRSSSWRLLAALLLLDVAGCGSGDIRPAYRLASNPTSVAMTVGQQAAVGVRWEGERLPNARLTWSAAPDSIVRVLGSTGDAVTLLAQRVGTTTVTATATDGRDVVRAAVSVTVEPLRCLPIGPVLTPAAVALTVGGRAQFTASLVPPPPCGPADGRVDFRIVDSTVASVDTLGWVTGRRIGVTALLASPRGNPGLSTAATVTVVGSGGVPPSITVQPSHVDITAGDTVRLQASISPPSRVSGSGVRLVSMDTTIATIDTSGLLRGVRAGQTHVRAIAVADTAFWAAVPVTVRAP